MPLEELLGSGLNWLTGSNAGGWGAAPGMAEAGYGLAPGVTEATVDPSNFLGGVSSKQVSDALGAAGKSSGGAAAAGKGTGPQMPGAGGGGAGVGRPTVQSLGPLLQLLNARRDALLQSATGGVGAGAPQGAKPTAGLLGF